jgi:hypothetical protein
MLLLVFPMPSMFLIIEMLLVAVMMISWHCHLLTSPCNQMFLHQTLPHLLASITIWNIMPTWKSRGTMLGRIHHMVKQPEWSSSKWQKLHSHAYTRATVCSFVSFTYYLSYFEEMDSNEDTPLTLPFLHRSSPSHSW